MAEQQQQSKGIGELFVEFGVKGLPTLLKGLNSVSASFLLTKNAAEQLTKSIKEVFKSAGNEAVGIGKMSALLGASVKDVQKITNYFKGKNVDPSSALSGIAKLQSAIYDIQNGRGGLDKNMQRGLDLLGINIWDYNQELESTLQLVEDIQTATKNLHPVDRQAHLRDIGIPEFGYLFERGEFNKSEIMTLSDSEIEKLTEAKEAAAELNIELDNLKNRGAAQLAPLTINITKQPVEIIEGLQKNDTKAKIKAVGVAGSTAGGVALGGSFGVAAGIGLVSGLSGPAAPLIAPLAILGSTAIGGFLGGNAGYRTGIGALGIGETLKEIFKNPSSKGQATGFAVPIVPPDMQNGHIPPNLSTSNNSVTYNNTFNITGSNAEEIGQEVKNQLDIQSLEFNQFQLENLPRR